MNPWILHLHLVVLHPTPPSKVLHYLNVCYQKLPPLTWWRYSSLKLSLYCDLFLSLQLQPWKQIPILQHITFHLPFELYLLHCESFSPDVQLLHLYFKFLWCVYKLCEGLLPHFQNLYNAFCSTRVSAWRKILWCDNVSTAKELGKVQGGSNMTGTDLCVNKRHCAAAVRPRESEATTSTLPPARVRTCSVLSGSC